MAPQVRRILQSAEPAFLTAYQILDRLPYRDELVAECAKGIRGSGAYHAAASMVREALVNHLGAEVHFDFVATKGATWKVAQTLLEPRHEMAAVYRLAKAAR
jgi:hypothetical protein